MSIQEQIQIVEDNLNEYGQSNITFEEYNFLKDELYSSGCLAGIELGRADAIEDCISIADGYLVDMPITHDNIIRALCKLKEQK